MSPQVLHHPPLLQIPKYTPEYPPHFLSRPRQGSSPSFFSDATHFVSASPIQSASPADTVDDDQIPSPESPPESSGAYHYDTGVSHIFESPVSPSEMYDTHPDNSGFSGVPPQFSSTQDGTHEYNIAPTTEMKGSDTAEAYLSDSPSPVDLSHPSPFLYSFSAPHSQQRFFHSSATRNEVSLNQTETLTSRYARPVLQPIASSHSYPSILDQRRMSEPAVLGSPNLYAANATDVINSGRTEQPNYTYHTSPSSNYFPVLHRGASVGSLRNLRQYHFDYPPPQAPAHTVFQEDQHEAYDTNGLDAPLSPMQPNFSGSLGVSSTLTYSPGGENYYGPSPPGTGTSTSSNPPSGLEFRTSQSQHQGLRTDNVVDDASADSTNSKTYSFVALPGNAVKKRPRRRYDEIERLYRCSWPDCAKSYGTLNHLNAHVTMQKHGSKRSPNEFKELRKQWRKAKKESEVVLSSSSARRSSLSLRHEDRGGYTSQRFGSALHAHRQSSTYRADPGIPSAPIPLPTMHYAMTMDEHPYPASVPDRDDELAQYQYASARQRYNSGMPASWHPGSSPPSRMNHQYSHVSSSAPSAYIHSSDEDVINSPQSAHIPRVSPFPHTLTHTTVNRLPPDSTLLTPLPGYQQPSLLSTFSQNKHSEDFEADDGRPMEPFS